MSHTSREARVSPALFLHSHGRHQGWEDWLWQWTCHLASLMAWMVNSVIALQETWLWSLVWKFPWRREWLPTPVFLPGEFHGQRSLASYSPWGFKDLDTTEWLTLSHYFIATMQEGWCGQSKTLPPTIFSVYPQILHASTVCWTPGLPERHFCCSDC